MSIRKRCFTYCQNECNSGWKLEEVPSKVVSKHCIPVEPCNPCSKKNNNVCTLISVKNPDTALVIPELLTVSKQNEFNVCVDLVKWTDIVIDALSLFNKETGTYTAPENGDYQVSLVINFETSVSIPVSELLDDVPSIELYDVQTGKTILASFLPTINIIVPIPPIGTEEPPVNVPVSSILGKGQVVINAVIPLIAGQRIRVRACTNGLVYIPTGEFNISAQQALPPARIIFNPSGADTTLSINKYRNSPTVTISCNN